MKINKFSKNKNSMWTIYLDDNSKLLAHEDLILKYDLLIKKELDEKTKEKIIKENKTFEVYEIAVSYLNKKLRSAKEIREYLKKKEYDIELIDNVIILLKDQGYLDEKLYANSYVHDQIVLTNVGPNKIRNYLEDNDISNEFIEEAMLNYNSDLERERIEKIVDKQIKTNNTKGANLLKRKIQMYLINLGYNYELINDVINSKKLVNEEVYKKEYEKIYNQLSKKYSGSELEYRLKQKLYQKGFTVE